jgi:hypothetical protein
LASIVKLRTKAQESIYNRYPLVGNRIPSSYETREITKAIESIQKYDVILWHRLLKNIYHDAQEVECELITEQQEGVPPETVILRRTDESSEWQGFNLSSENISKIQQGKIVFSNWKYYFGLPTGGIVSIGSINRCTSIQVALVLCGIKPNAGDEQEADKFISLLLDEANKSNLQLFNPEKEFQEAEGLRSYIVSNVYLTNYKSAEFMLETAVSQEQQLRDELYRYDATRLDLTMAQNAHINQYGLVCGMYYLSAMIYFYMSLEGFINVIFHSFLRKSVKEGPLNEKGRFQLEKKISDVELKLRLLPVLCDGFVGEHLNASSDVFAKFHKLTEYRNSIFHSNVENSLRSLVFVEDGFMY